MAVAVYRRPFRDVHGCTRTTCVLIHVPRSNSSCPSPPQAPITRPIPAPFITWRPKTFNDQTFPFKDDHDCLDDKVQDKIRHITPQKLGAGWQNCSVHWYCTHQRTSTDTARFLEFRLMTAHDKVHELRFQNEIYDNALVIILLMDPQEHCNSNSIPNSFLKTIRKTQIS